MLSFLWREGVLIGCLPVELHAVTVDSFLHRGRRACPCTPVLELSLVGAASHEAGEVGFVVLFGLLAHSHLVRLVVLHVHRHEVPRGRVLHPQTFPDFVVVIAIFISNSALGFGVSPF